MSYNIDTITVLDGEAKIRAVDLLALDEDCIPEGNFIEELEARAKKLLRDEGPEALLDVVINGMLWWYGECSGHDFDYLKEKVVPMFRGRLELLIVWEGGEEIEGAIIENGKWVECDVEYTLTPKAT